MANAKGTTMISFVRFLCADLGRALEILPPEHHHYLDERIALSSWYPEEDLLALIRAGTSLLRGEREAALRGFGRADAHDQLGGDVYADLRQSDDPLALPRRVFALWSSRHDTGQMKLRMETDRRGCLELEDYGHPSIEICTMLTGFLSEVLTSADLRDPRVTKTACRMDNEPVCTWRFTWA